jgi:hypothetical protein
MSPRPTSRGVAWLAWGLALLCLSLVGALILVVAASDTSLSKSVSDHAFAVVFALVFPFTGALVASRHPRNAVGWLMIGAPLFSILSEATDVYAPWSFPRAPGPPGMWRAGSRRGPGVRFWGWPHSSCWSCPTVGPHPGDGRGWCT